MAKEEVVSYRYTCDVCGHDIPGQVKSVHRRIRFDGKDYELDLCEKDQRGFDKAVHALHLYLEAGRKVSAARSHQRTARRDATAVRAWARAHGWPDLPDRGRMPTDVQAAYEAAGSPE